MELGCMLFVGAFCRYLAPIAVNMFSYFIYFINKFMHFVLSMRFAK
jgi:hypothetical protein